MYFPDRCTDLTLLADETLKFNPWGNNYISLLWRDPAGSHHTPPFHSNPNHVTPLPLHKCNMCPPLTHLAVAQKNTSLTIFLL